MCKYVLIAMFMLPLCTLQKSNFKISLQRWLSMKKNVVFVGENRRKFCTLGPFVGWYVLWQYVFVWGRFVGDTFGCGGRFVAGRFELVPCHRLAVSSNRKRPDGHLFLEDFIYSIGMKSRPKTYILR